ncbi:MAG: hypothetical protein AB7S80_17485 [Rhizobiaceae bacterium]
MSPLEQKFSEAMFNIYQKAKNEAGYNATIFLGMLSSRGGIATARYLINAAKPSDGYTALFERGRLDLTVEAMITENAEWHALFSAEEIARALKRLDQYGYSRKK